MNRLEQMNQTLQVLWLRLVTPQQLHYINGADTLPAPLAPQQEQQALAALEIFGPERETLIRKLQ